MSVVSVIQFPDRRSTAPDNGDLLTCECGSAWFELRVAGEDGKATEPGAIVMDQNGHIGGYYGLPYCRECGMLKIP